MNKKYSRKSTCLKSQNLLVGTFSSKVYTMYFNLFFRSRMYRTLRAVSSMRGHLRPGVITCSLKLTTTQTDSKHLFISPACINSSLIGQQSRAFQTTFVPLKKFDPTLYDLVSVFDPDGHFVMDVEFLVLQKFCHKYNRFSYVEYSLEKDTEGDSKLKRYKIEVKQIKEKIQKKKTKKAEIKDEGDEADTSGGKHVKLIKFSKDSKGMREQPKLQKVIEILVNHGKVRIQFSKVSSLLFITSPSAGQTILNILIISIKYLNNNITVTF